MVLRKKNTKAYLKFAKGHMNICNIRFSLMIWSFYVSQIVNSNHFK